MTAITSGSKVTGKADHSFLAKEGPAADRCGSFFCQTIGQSPPSVLLRRNAASEDSSPVNGEERNGVTSQVLVSSPARGGRVARMRDRAGERVLGQLIQFIRDGAEESDIRVARIEPRVLHDDRNRGFDQRCIRRVARHRFRVFQIIESEMQRAARFQP